MTGDEVEAQPADVADSNLPDSEKRRNPRKIDSGYSERPVREIRDSDGDLSESRAAILASLAPLYVTESWVAIEDLQLVSRSSRGDVGNKIRAARRAGEALVAQNRWGEASEEFALAVELLRQLVIETVDRESRERQLVHHATLVADAVAVAVVAKREDLAVELFETAVGYLRRSVGALQSVRSAGGKFSRPPPAGRL